MISNDENEHVTDPQLRNTLYDYENRSNVNETQTMAFMMKKRTRLCEDSELPKIDFSMSHYDVKHDTQYEKQGPFFKALYEDPSGEKQPDLQKNLIVQSKKLDANDMDGYNKAQYLKENQVTL